MRNQSPHRSRDGFTLVELLVVIGIIALLISILLPALNKARAQAQKVQCGSNLHQIGLACAEYATNNKGFYPYSLSPGTNELVGRNDTSLPSGLGVLLGDWNVYGPTFSSSFNVPNTYLASRKVLQDPGLYSDNGGAYNDAFNGVARFCSYAYCVPKAAWNPIPGPPYTPSSSNPSAFFPAISWRPGQLIPTGLPPTWNATPSVSSASDLFSSNGQKWNAIASCFLYDKNWTEAQVPSAGLPHQNAGPNRKGGGVNVLYADGSVTFVPRPSGILPAGLGYGVKDVYGNTPTDAAIGWPYSFDNSTNQEGGNTDDFLLFWAYVNAMYR
jgi:prepilin-type N-terminal cleavage/methylation domain-containing protein/prepilin-type processing-associated H-X9-DG protein